ncbi:hypothetical protein LUZ60_005195 [Juncus effusus]|nr:hypothetical protein LUZ60_005195 [Juncus effusus]
MWSNWIHVGSYDNYKSYVSSEVCSDENVNCKQWALSGECEKNVGYMSELSDTRHNTCSFPLNSQNSRTKKKSFILPHTNTLLFLTMIRSQSHLFPLSLFTFSLLTLPSLSSSSCQPFCGGLQIHYPFGSGPGCGSPLFQPHVTCNYTTQTLTLTTRSGSYPIQSIDYINQILTLTDPTMSTCFSLCTSPGFSLSADAPFTFVYTNIFALLRCSNINYTLCDTTSPHICGLLYTCQPYVTLSQAVSTCCVYEPASLGPQFEMDLTQLGCGSYSAVYDFGGTEGNPAMWRYGIAVKYRFSVDNWYPSFCGDCERSNGVCGFNGEFNEQFVCNCANGVNSTSNCHFTGARWSSGKRIELFKSGFWLVASFLLFGRRWL